MEESYAFGVIWLEGIRDASVFSHDDPSRCRKFVFEKYNAQANIAVYSALRGIEKMKG